MVRVKMEKMEHHFLSPLTKLGHCLVLKATPPPTLPFGHQRRKRNSAFLLIPTLTIPVLFHYQADR